MADVVLRFGRRLYAVRLTRGTPACLARVTAARLEGVELPETDLRALLQRLPALKSLALRFPNILDFLDVPLGQLLAGLCGSHLTRLELEVGQHWDGCSMGRINHDTVVHGTRRLLESLLPLAGSLQELGFECGEAQQLDDNEDYGLRYLRGSFRPLAGLTALCGLCIDTVHDAAREWPHLSSLSRLTRLELPHARVRCGLAPQLVANPLVLYRLAKQLPALQLLDVSDLALTNRVRAGLLARLPGLQQRQPCGLKAFAMAQLLLLSAGLFPFSHVGMFAMEGEGEEELDEEAEDEEAEEDEETEEETEEDENEEAEETEEQDVNVEDKDEADVKLEEDGDGREAEGEDVGGAGEVQGEVGHALGHTFSQQVHVGD